jgi:hypothetical protein
MSRSLTWLDLLPQIPSKEVVNVFAYFLGMIFERKMSTVYKVDFGIWSHPV